MKQESLFLALLGTIGIGIISLLLVQLQAFDSSTLLIVDNVAPSITSVKVCATTGDPSGCAHVSNITLTGGTTTTYTVAGTLEDENGFYDIDLFVARLRRSAVSPACTFDENNCYLLTTAALDCVLTPLNFTQGTFECIANMQYFSDATDDASLISEGAYPSDNWTVVAYANDYTNESSELTNYTEISSLRDLSACASINYGTLANGAASSTGIACPITNDGNVDIDIEISGTAMTCTAGSIPIGNQLADIANGSYASMAASGTHYPYTATATTYSDIILNKRTTSVVTDDLYHTITVPFAVSGSCSGTNTISAVAEV